MVDYSKLTSVDLTPLPATAAPHHNTLREALAQAGTDLFNWMGYSDSYSRGDTATNILENTTGLGAFTSAQDAQASANRGDIAGTAGNLGMAALSMIPGAGGAKTVAKEAGGATRETLAGIKAFHGSPHHFERFDFSKIGTGEGAQAYGHGGYFATNEGIARGYRDRLSQIEYGGKAMSPGDMDWHLAQSAIQHKGVTQADADYISSNFTEAVREGLSIDNLERNFLSNYKPGDGMYEAIQSVAEEARKAKMQTGAMYEVNIAADPAHFIDYDLPLSQQSPQVQEALQKAGWSPEHMKSDVLTGSYVAPETQYGTDLYSKAGIPGIKYLDAGSRGAGEGSRNYVVFDDKLVSIVRKYGLAGAIGAGLITAEMGQQMQDQGLL